MSQVTTILNLPNTFSAGTAIEIAGVQCWDSGLQYDIPRWGTGRAERRIVCAWGSAMTLAYTLLGQAPVQGGPNSTPAWVAAIQAITQSQASGIQDLTGLYTHFSAGSFPQPWGLPSIPAFLASGCRFRGIPAYGELSNYFNTQLGQTTQMVGYLLAEFTLTYESQRFQANEVGELSFGIVEEAIRPSGSVPQFSFTPNDNNAGDAVTVEDQPGIHLVVENFTFTRRYQTAFPQNTALTLGQYPVNSVDLYCTYCGVVYNWGAGTVKFVGAEPEYSPTGFGEPSWRVAWHFKARPALPWNCIQYVSGTSTQVNTRTLYYMGQNTTIYGTSDLNVITSKTQPT